MSLPGVALATALAGTLMTALAGTLISAQAPTTEVRQLVAFQFLPGASAEATRLFRDEALPLYVDNASMIRFRGYREAESPTPVDLLVVSTFAGMAGMDASNEALRRNAEAQGTSIGALYGRIGALSREHRDEFVEIDSELSWGSTDDAELIVVTSQRIEPGRREAYESLMRERILEWEREDVDGLTGADGGAYLISDGWDYIRILGVRTLGDWHAYLRSLRSQSWFAEYDRSVSHERQHVLVPVPELSVR